MRIFITILILILNLQSLTKADEINEFEIEGISIGDSLLDHVTENDILNNLLNYPYTSDKYYAVNIAKSKFLKLYDAIEIYLKKDDKKYIVFSIDAANFYENRDKCLNDMDEITNDISNIFNTQKNSNKEKLQSRGDPTGTSFYYRTDWIIGDRNFVAIECYFWSQYMKDKYNNGDHLRISATTKELNNWLQYEAFN
tara:strand:+ start:117 stop:707 length:591 start_codon:yes stop_codon:yes gene_type:complete